MKDRHFERRDKTANLLFDLAKYLLTTAGAVILLHNEPVNVGILILTFLVALLIFILAVYITPAKGY